MPLKVLQAGGDDNEASAQDGSRPRQVRLELVADATPHVSCSVHTNCLFDPRDKSRVAVEAAEPEKSALCCVSNDLQSGSKVITLGHMKDC